MSETTEPAPALGADLANVDAAQLAALAAGATDEQLAEGMSDPAARQSILDEIFRRMAEHVDAEKAKGIDAILMWKITDKPGGGEDTYEVTLNNGIVTVSQEPTATPRVTFTVGPAAFLRLVSGAQPGPVLFMAGKLKIEGDLMFASQVATMFRIPQAAS
jgi:alkyl sulfatase BDS1-like metallo-beta-lactamase superfamily hydrolase